VAISATVASAQNVSDSTPPQVSAVAFSQTAVDTTAGDQSVTASVTVTDDLSGVNYLYIYLQTTSTSQPANTRSLSCYVGTLQSGSRTNGVLTGSCYFPRYSQSGTWYAYQVYVYDNVGNNRSYYNSNQQLSFAPQTISVTSLAAPPATVPTLLSMTVSPGSVDTSNSSQTLTFDAHITSGGDFNYGYVYLYDPSGGQSTSAYFYNSSRILGDVNDGVYRTTATLPRYSRAGNWNWNFAYFFNSSSGYSGYQNAVNGAFTQLYVYNGATSTSTNLGAAGPTLSPQTLAVTSNPSDAAGPTLVDFQISPSSIDVATQSATVNISVAATDALSGFNYGYVYFVSPNGQQVRGAYFYSNNPTASIFFPQYSEAGNWQMSYMYLFDMLGNYTYITPAYLLEHGFSNSLQISSGLAVPNVSVILGGSVTLSAVLTQLGTPVAGKTIAFTLQGNPVGTAITDATGTATLPNISTGSIAVGTYVNAIGAAFAGDGSLAAASGQGTLVVTNKLSQTITFAAIPNQPVTASPLGISATASSGLTVSFAAVGACTVSGTTVTFTGTGSCQIVASQPGNATYNPAPTVSRTFTISKVNQTISFAALGNRTYGDDDFTVAATAASGLAVTFTASGACSVAGSTVHLTSAGTCTITASQAGDDTYNAAPSVPRSFSIARANQTITFAALPGRTVGDASFTVNATASSGLAVSFALGFGSVGCSVSGSTVAITGATGSGQSCSIVASQNGNGNYNAAPAVTQSFTVSKAGQTITFGAISNRSYGDPAFTLAASSSSGLSVAFALGVGSAGCSLSGSTLTITGATSAGQQCSVVASQGGNANYNAAVSVTQSFAIAKGTQTIAFATISNATYGDPASGLSATASSGLPVAFALGTGSAGCAVSGSTLSITGATAAGEFCQVVASQSGNGNYNAAAAVTQSFTIAKKDQSITFAAIGNRTYGDDPFGLAATAPAGTVTFALGSPSTGCSVSGSTVTITGATGAGQACVIVASQSGDANHLPAPDATQSFGIAKAAQAITFSALEDKTFGDAPFALTATAPGGAVTFALGSSSTGCSVSGSTVSITGATGAGQSCVIVASQAGGGNHTAAPDVTRSFSIAKGSQTIAFDALPNRTFGNSPFALTASAPGGTVSFALGTGSVGCSVSGNTVTITGATGPGQSCSIVASQSGNGNYNAAPAVAQTFSIARAAQTIAFAALGGKTYGDASFSLTATAAGGAVSFALGAGSAGCSVSGSLVTILGATGVGESCVIVASQPGNANYSPAEDVSRSFAIARASQTIAFGAPGNKTYGDAPFTVGASASSSLPVLFGASGSCSVSGAVVTITSGGTCTVTASQPGNANYKPAVDVSQSFGVVYTWSDILQPVNVDGSSVFKAGSTIPVKFRLTGASASVTTLAARIYVAPISNAVVGTELEAASVAVADLGNTFRYDSTADQYIFNLSTKGMSQGTWQIRVDLLDGALHTVLVSLKK